MQADSSQRKRWRSENVTDVEPFVLQNAFDSPMTAKVAPLVTLPASTTKVLPAELVRAAAAARNSPLNNPSAVGYPTCVVIYCLSTFTFDRAAFAINVEVFPPGWLERSASAFADPVQNAVIYKSLSSLRIHSVYEFVTRIGVNVALGLRLHTVVGAIRDPGRQRCAAYPKRQRMLPFLLVMYALLLVLFVVRSTKTSTAACEAHPNCAVFAKRWVPAGGAAEPKCPCLMLVDCDFGPKTYAEWLRPKDATESVAALAAMGLLQTVQVMNRYLPVIPQELRSCTDLRYLSLVYTHTATFPDWFGEFAKMEYMFVEGNPAAALVALPENMFDLMPSLTYLHLAWHVAMPRLPSLHGLTALKSLELAGLLSLQTLPSFSSLHQLERFVLSASPLVDRLPDLAAIENLQTFSAYDRGAWCCNGDLGRCDLQNPLCAVHPVWGTPAATCLHPEQVASEATIKLAAKFAPTICGPVLHPSDLEPPLTEAMVAQCGGTRFKRCELPGFDEAICYNMRFTVLTCVHSPFTIKMRRRQIQERVGDPCSVEHEAWLGCT
ncbi:hypothetical protein PHYPSEUDO_012548 [Phytophthora pseudosyringae]|uniref:WLGC domain-containing protein n=1 Tax=Phytophthora pseudosyringae TaxID=221518 RepID=A0A8T1V6L0_9STRA|nr:hypothetical protein PHYPSEUDO_012548 [Phytophthora pseudosyringae]